MRGLVCLLGLIALAIGARTPHPLDGPDLDLRIRIGDTGVMLDVSFNLAFLDEVLPMARADEFVLAEHERPVLRDRMFAWLRLNTAVRVDGDDVPLQLADFSVDRGDPALLPLFPIMGMKALVCARFRLRCATARPPSTVNLVWHAFAPDQSKTTTATRVFLPLRASLAAGGDEQTIVLQHDEPEFTWHAPAGGLAVRLLPVPSPVARRVIEVPTLSAAVVAVLVLLTAGAAWRRRGTGATAARSHRPVAPWLAVSWLVGVGVAASCWRWARLEIASPFAPRPTLPTVAQAAAIFAPLHANVYRAFDSSTPSAVYDVLAESVDGSLLDTVYQDVYRSLVMQDQGGASSRVQAVRALATDVEAVGVLADGATPSFTVRANWLIDAAVFHWGHAHARTSRLRARYTVVATPQGWRIAGAEPLQQERLPLGPSATREGGR